MADNLDRQQIEQVVTTLADREEGDWLLIGGALVALWLLPRRTTQDVDLVSLGDDPGARLRLMDVAQDLGLSVEAVNSAADFFVRRVPGWQEEIELLHQGAKGRIYRPTPTLFLLLKMGRLSEQDLDDCRAAVAQARQERLPLDRPRLLVELDRRVRTQDLEPDVRRRIAVLRELLTG